MKPNYLLMLDAINKIIYTGVVDFVDVYIWISCDKPTQRFYCKSVRGSLMSDA